MQTEALPKRGKAAESPGRRKLLKSLCCSLQTNLSLGGFFRQQAC
uniref:Uncharacterized protein n=1 Tax=Anguilla anguilla TaxID=7936 RepID=A0A0E9T0P2_ANGAN